MLSLVLSAVAAPLAFTTHTGGGVGFRVESSAGAVVGTVDTFTATLDLVEGRGALVIDPASLTTGLGPRDQRMLVYCLDVATFPELRFDVQRVQRAAGSDGDEGPVSLVGELTVRGVTAPVVVPALVTREGDVLRLRGEVPLSFATFSIPDPSVLVAHVEPMVTVTFDLRGAPTP